jgi:hypothetical protein
VSFFNVKMSDATVNEHNNNAVAIAIAEFFKSQTLNQCLSLVAPTRAVTIVVIRPLGERAFVAAVFCAPCSLLQLHPSHLSSSSRQVSELSWRLFSTSLAHRMLLAFAAPLMFFCP